jgi:glycosyltransferase involved in cell wall biosynthesis
LDQLIARRGLHDCCHLLGHRSDAKRLYQAMDVYVQSSEYEGTPTVLVEAMAMGVPIVATDVGGTTELVEPDRHAIVVRPHSVPALTEAVRHVLENSEASRERVRNARSRAESELSMNYRMAKLASIYRSVLAMHHGEAGD